MRHTAAASRSGALVLVVLALLALPSCALPWPFGDDSDDGTQKQPESGLPPDFPQGIFESMPRMSMPQGMPQGMPRIAFGGAPVVVVRGHFGFDPWEDLHHNMQRVIQDNHGPQALAAHGGAADGRHLVAKPLSMQLDNLLGAFGDHHAGHVGRAEGSFQVDDDHHTRLRITAELPGYNLGDSHTPHPAAESPLSVRAIGHRSLVVSGSQQNGPFIRTWQRTFSLPKGTDIDHISVTYNSKSGNLTVDVPRKNVTETSAEEEEDDDDDGAELDEMLPPALRAIRQGLPGLLDQLAHGGGQVQMGSLGGNSLRGKTGFLVPAAQVAGPNIGQILGMMGEMHPRFQLPQGGERPLPEDAEVTLVGCFAESQLEKVELKYYGEANAASFNAMYWHARDDHVPYFAMSRHGEPLGHAFTAHGFAHVDEKPKWGVYDGCGSRCMDDDSRWCGCSNEASRGFANPECSEGDSEKRFAVYKIVENAVAAPENASSEASMNESVATASSQSAAHGRPYWQLTNDDGSKEPEIEIVVPKGTVAKAQGRQVLLYNTSDSSSSEAATPATAEPTVEGSTEGETAEAEASTSTGAAPVATEAAAAPTAAPIGKMRLPVGVSQEDCTWESGRVNEDGSQVMKCKIAQNAVKQVPIKVIDEL